MTGAVAVGALLVLLVVSLVLNIACFVVVRRVRRDVQELLGDVQTVGTRVRLLDEDFRR